MRLSKTAVYALQAVLQLAAGKVLTCHQIAVETGVPERYLTSVLRLLCRRGTVQSLRGSEGGFRLTCQPDGISLMDIIEAVDGPVVVGLPTDSALPAAIHHELLRTLQQIAQESRRHVGEVRLIDLLQLSQQSRTPALTGSAIVEQSSLCPG